MYGTVQSASRPSTSTRNKIPIIPLLRAVVRRTWLPTGDGGTLAVDFIADLHRRRSFRRPTHHPTGKQVYILQGQATEIAITL
jgi:hypothetical protein